MIDERLRAHIESLATPVTRDDVSDPIYTTVAIGRTPLARPAVGRRPLAVAVAIIVVVSVVAFVADRGQQHVLARPGAWTVVEEATATFAAQPDGPLGAVAIAAIAAIVPYRNRLIAAGSVSGEEQSTAAIWTSADGRAWNRLTSNSFEPVADRVARSGSSINHLTVRGERLVAFGSTTTTVDGSGSYRLSAWTSDDGEQWQRHNVPGDGSPRIDNPGAARASLNATSSAIVATPDGFLAFANDNGDPVSGARNLPLVFSSPDGVAWSPIEAKGLDERGAYVVGALAYRDHLIAYGSRGGHSGQPATWTSDDGGATWRIVPLPWDNAKPYGVVERAVATSSGLLLTGGTRIGSVSASSPTLDAPIRLDGELDTVSWLSTDGVTFEQFDTSPLNSAGFDYVTAVTPARGGALLALDRIEPGGKTTHFYSWSTATGFVEEGAGEVASVSALADFRGAFLAVAAAANAFRIEGRGPATLLWRATHR